SRNPASLTPPAAALPGPRSASAWLITVAATAASTYALDAVATAAGVLLVASQLGSGLDHTLVLAFLAMSYVLWGVGLRVNLRANWLLLRRTGTSTNVLSKAAFELTRRRGERTQRFAAGAGYVATELAKEAPYYAGAFGATLLSDSVRAHDALVFLAGANLGAAVYEYGLGRLTGAFLRRGYASFDDDWVPGEYLADYYAEVEPDELETIAFFVDAMRNAEPGRPVLLFGVGPTLHHVFLAAPHASELHLADYLPGNLREIERWLEREPGAHDWRPFVHYTLQCEGIADPTSEQVAEREALTRAKVTRLLEVDARRPVALDEPYATVISAYCADSATDDRATWETFMGHIAALVRPGGVFLTSALRRCRHYVVGGKRFPCANVDEHDVRAVLERRFECTTVEARELAGHAAQGYSGIVLAWAYG
ncbi:MAG TPA: guanitoxin biosynthesis pre-guanitoxin forming N-methyltransferase GntF, partial [Solirubrobacteraceae bacterium]|nr:guanitoxin biosynthesis pre-guanitoxin forming N-methyltransferase GntF [Solirubrobacteraceae bacterium]